MWAEELGRLLRPTSELALSGSTMEGLQRGVGVCKLGPQA